MRKEETGLDTDLESTNGSAQKNPISLNDMDSVVS